MIRRCLVAATLTVGVLGGTAAATAAVPALGAGGVRLLAVDGASPSAVSGLRATSVAPTAVNLEWNAATDAVGVTQYIVWRGDASWANWVQLKTVTSPTMTYLDSTVSASKGYTYGIRALDAAGNVSAASNTIAVTTPASSPVTPPPGPVTPPVTGNCAATLTLNGGRPWACTAFSNTLIPTSPRLHATETSLLRRLSGTMLNIDAYSEPVRYAQAGTAQRGVRCTSYACVGGTTAPITGSEWVAPGSDGQSIIVDLAQRKSYELYAVTRDADGTIKINADGSVSAGSMSVVALDGPGNKSPTGQNLNITGSGLSRMFGLISANEVRAAATRPLSAIPHALQVALPTNLNCASGFRSPATKTDGRGTGACVQEGARFQLDPAYNCAGLSKKLSQAICAALQTYGAFDIDNSGSSNIVFYAQHRKSWPTADADYAAVGIGGDYTGLGLPISMFRSLVSANG